MLQCQLLARSMVGLQVQASLAAMSTVSTFIGLSWYSQLLQDSEPQTQETREVYKGTVWTAHGEGARRMHLTLVETACFLEPHASGLMHHNCFVRPDTQ